MKYLFVTMLEGALVLLARHDVLPGALAATMAQAVRFRNLLVHGYAEVDDRRVVGYLDALDDVAAYVACLARLL